MRYLLSPSSKAILTKLSQERTLYAFDFDGTLSPIVAHPKQARMRAETRRLLGRLAALHPCVVLSGRARADLLGKLQGIEVARVIGNHGAETETTASPSKSNRQRRQVQQWKTALERELKHTPGLWVEDKGLSIAVHFRQSRQKAEARDRILAVTSNLDQVRLFGGKQVLNLVMDRAPNKGDALAAERKRLKCDWILYVGDDENDEDAFALEGNIVPVRVGRKRRSRASYYLRTQTEIDKLLELLVMQATRQVA